MFGLGQEIENSKKPTTLLGLTSDKRQKRKHFLMTKKSSKNMIKITPLFGVGMAFKNRVQNRGPFGPLKPVSKSDPERGVLLIRFLELRFMVYAIQIWEVILIPKRDQKRPQKRGLVDPPN